MTEHIIVNDTPLLYLDCKEAFEGLTEDEKLYVHLLNRASWCGGLICLVQTSPESPGLFLIMQRIFRKQSPSDFEKLAQSVGLSETESMAVMIYFAAVYGNLGNYMSFGDSKFVPNIDEDKFSKLIEATEAYKSEPGTAAIWTSIKSAVFSLDSRVQNLGMGPNGLTTYFSSNCTQTDAELAQKFMDKYQISGYNTRLFKVMEGEKPVYHIRQAGSVSSKSVNNLGDVQFIVESGDYTELMTLMVENLKEVQKAALNDNERNMFKHYIASFTNGSIEEHKKGSLYWIKDKGPVVENYIGFIESYRDPFGVRGEFESFIAVVNKAMSAKFSVLVDHAPEFLSHLPWGADYEKDTFLQPDFTSLDIVNFASSGIPIGINIPNYDDIRQTDGFKNVSLGNVLTSRFKDPKVSFLEGADKELYLKHIAEAFEIQVGLHELIGHGSGKLFKVDSEGVLNFDKDRVVDLNGGPIKSWYGPNETWDGKFTNIASPIEECRAECVGVYLCTLPDVLKVFGHDDPAVAQDVAFINWLCMARAGLASLELYTPTTGAWRQAHSQARFAILQVLLEAGQDLVTIKTVTADDGKPDLLVKMDRTKIESVARPAIGEFLKKLQFYKSIGDAESGRTFFLKYCVVNETFRKLRETVLERKKPRPLIVQCNTRKDTSTGAISMVEYDGNVAGIIQSYLDRFADLKEAEEALEAVWKRDEPYMKF